MPAKRELTMRQIRQMLRLARDGVSAREIGRTLGVARSTIQDNLKRALTAGLAWPLAGDLTDAVLEQRLFAHAGVRRGFRRRREPDWASLACELKRPATAVLRFISGIRAAGCLRRCGRTIRPATRSLSIAAPATGNWSKARRRRRSEPRGHSPRAGGHRAWLAGSGSTSAHSASVRSLG
jgi:Homeodomain-like domain